MDLNRRPVASLWIGEMQAARLATARRTCRMMCSRV